MPADIEAVLVSWLTGRTGVLTVAELNETDGPPNAVPVLHVEELPEGREIAPGLVQHVVEINAYAVGRGPAKRLAQVAADQVAEMRGVVFDAGRTSVNDALCAPPSRLPWDDDSEIRRYGARCRIVTHSWMAPVALYPSSRVFPSQLLFPTPARWVGWPAVDVYPGAGVFPVAGPFDGAPSLWLFPGPLLFPVDPPGFVPYPAPAGVWPSAGLFPLGG